MENIQQKRTVAVFFMTVVAMFLVALRVVGVALDPRFIDAEAQNRTRKIAFSLQRGTVFDCNMTPMTNIEKRYALLITDTPKAVVTLSRYFDEEYALGLLEKMKKAKEPIIIIDREISGDGIICYEFSERAQNQAKHLIGYVGNDGHGVSGIEAAFDDILYSGKEATLEFSVDGIGNLIKGEKITFSSNEEILNSGVMLTIDSRIQKIAEKAADRLVRGAVVVSEVKNGEIKAVVSRPDFNLKDLKSAINNSDSPLINRAFAVYNVGSGFKPCVAASALEKGMKNYLALCLGHCEIDGQIFRCHKTAGHNWLTMAGALKHSCNSYFYRLAIDVGAKDIFAMAELAGFNNSVALGYGYETDKQQIGNLTVLSKSDRALANLAIGQGDLMLSPIGILTLYSAIAGDGCYYPLSIIKGKIEKGQLSDPLYEYEKIRIMSEKTAATLREYLSGVLEEGGTGYIGRPKTVSAAGKTSTAETGIIENGERVVNTWFCGFFPLEEPKYVVSVLAEKTSQGCGEVFAEIADEVSRLFTE